MLEDITSCTHSTPTLLPTGAFLEANQNGKPCMVFIVLARLEGKKKTALQHIFIDVTRRCHHWIGKDFTECCETKPSDISTLQCLLVESSCKPCEKYNKTCMFLDNVVVRLFYCCSKCAPWHCCFEASACYGRVTGYVDGDLTQVDTEKPERS